MVHDVEAEHSVVATAQVTGARVAGGRVAVPEPHPVGHPGGGDDLAADRRKPLRRGIALDDLELAVLLKLLRQRMAQCRIIVDDQDPA